MTVEGLTYRGGPAEAGASDGAVGAPAFLVIPGGGYEGYGQHEAEPVADWLAGLGLHTFVLRYPVRTRHPGPLDAARAALAWIRSGEHAVALDPARVGVIGFSAGGHLAASLATLPDGEAPDRVVLGYPVISLESDTHEGSVANLLGPDAGADLRRSLSPDRLVTSAHPPAFVWHTADDGAVPVSNALRYANALVAAGVPVDLHVFARGEHGAGLGRVGVDPGPEWWTVAADQDLVEWTGLCERWLARAGWIAGR